MAAGSRTSRDTTSPAPPPRDARRREPPTCSARDVQRALRAVADSRRIAGVSAFFRTAPGEYGEGDRFLGVSVPAQRRIAARFGALPLPEAVRLLRSPMHEDRLTALLILVDRFERVPDATEQRKVFDAYLRNRRYVNNWDLVDTSAAPILGGWLQDRSRALLDRMAASGHLWSRRMAIIATFHYIRQGDARDALRVAAALIDDPHDLIHKACGWMLREVGKRVAVRELRGFLRQHAAAMPRVMLRYAIERLPAAERQRWLRVERNDSKTRALSVRARNRARSRTASSAPSAVAPLRRRGSTPKARSSR